MQYQGSCHCGRIAFSVETEAPIETAVDCNCSLCRRRGGLLWFGPRSALSLHSDPAQLGSYRFNKMHIDHHHCPHCGIAPFSEADDPRTGVLMVAVNLRCLPEVDLRALSITAYDGAAH